MPILRNGVISVLPSIRILQLSSSNRQPINEQSQVHRPMRLPNAVMQLPRNSQHIGPILGKCVHRQRMPRSKVSQINLHSPIPNPPPQHIKHAPRINLSRNSLSELPLRRFLIPVQAGKSSQR